MGAEVAPVEAGARTLKEAVSAAIRDWVTNVGDTHYIIGSAVGPAPYPALVRDLQRVIGDEAREQVLAGRGRAARPRDRLRRRRLERDRALLRVRRRPGRADRRRGRRGRASTAATAPRSSAGRTGVLHGALSSVLADEDGQILEAHSISAGLDYPGVGPEHAKLRDTGRARYVAITDDEALLAFRELARLEGIIPALEPSHAVAWLLEGRRRWRRCEGLRRPLPLRTRGQGPRRGDRRLDGWRRWRNGTGGSRRVRGRARAGPGSADALPDGRLSRTWRPRWRCSTPTPPPAPT